MLASRGVVRCAGPLLAVLALAGCSSDDEKSTAGVSGPQARTTVSTTEPDRAQLVYDAYLRHCKEFTYEALVFPRAAVDARDAARQYAGSPRRHRQAAFRGCLAGLRAGTPTITLADVKRAAAEEAEEHGDG